MREPAQNAVVYLEGRNFPRTVVGQVVFVFSTLCASVFVPLCGSVGGFGPPIQVYQARRPTPIEWSLGK
jgi:hypothetical protein